MKKLLIITALLTLSQGAYARSCGDVGYIFASMTWNHDWKTEFKAVCKNEEKDVKFTAKKIYRDSPIEMLNQGYELTLTDQSTGEEFKRFNYDGYTKSDFKDSLQAIFNGTNEVTVKYLDKTNEEVTLMLSCKIKVRENDSCFGAKFPNELPDVTLGKI